MQGNDKEFDVETRVNGNCETGSIIELGIQFSGTISLVYPRQVQVSVPQKQNKQKPHVLVSIWLLLGKKWSPRSMIKLLSANQSS